MLVQSIIVLLNENRFECSAGCLFPIGGAISLSCKAILPPVAGGQYTRTKKCRSEKRPMPKQEEPFENECFKGQKIPKNSEKRPIGYFLAG